jgi:DNA-binding MltR family transcriptional regulator
MDEWIEAAAEEARSVALGMLRERGRGAVLVGVARVDAALEALLKAALAPPRGSESLFHTDRPLGSFGAKIALAARLGLIDAAVEQSLHNLRRVRNAFAHSTAEVRLADPPYRDRLRESVALARRNLLWEPMQLILNRHMAERGRPARRRTILVAFLETGASTVRPLQPSLTMTLETGIRQRAGLTQ